jgi:hypothetical protein
MKKSILTFIASIFFILTFLTISVSADLGIFKAGDDISLIQTCNTCDYCNLTTIKYPNSSNIISEIEPMTRDGTFYNFTLNSIYTNTLGTYKYCYECGDETDKVTGCINFDITHAGVSPSTAQSGLSFGIMITMILIMFFFGFLGFKFIDYEKLYPIGLFFLIVAILLSIYGLYLGVVYSRDYLYASTSAPQTSLFLTITYGLVGMVFIALVFFTFKVVGEIKERKSMVKYGNNWNTKTQQYDY